MTAKTLAILIAASALSLAACEKKEVHTRVTETSPPPTVVVNPPAEKAETPPPTNITVTPAPAPAPAPEAPAANTQEPPKASQ